MKLMPVLKKHTVVNNPMFISYSASAMARLIRAPTRFTHEDWTRSNLKKYANADVERQQAERLISESNRLKEETAKRTERTQADVTKKLGNNIVMYD